MRPIGSRRSGASAKGFLKPTWRGAASPVWKFTSSTNLPYGVIVEHSPLRALYCVRALNADGTPSCFTDCNNLCMPWWDTKLSLPKKTSR